nr:hypothetical protein [Candidatus Sigynarchaeota archaeon]
MDIGNAWFPRGWRTMTRIKRYKRLEPREKVLRRLGWHRDRGSGSDGDEWQEWVTWYGGKIPVA